MGEIRNPRPVKLFIAVLYEERNILEDILPQLENDGEKLSGLVRRFLSLTLTITEILEKT